MSSLDEKQVKILNGLAVLQMSCGRASEALPLLHLSHRLAEHEPHTCYLLASAYHRLGDTEQSSAFFSKFEANSMERTSAKALLLKSIVSLKNGSVSEARYAFVNALKKLSKQAKVYKAETPGKIEYAEEDRRTPAPTQGEQA